MGTWVKKLRKLRKRYNLLNESCSAEGIKTQEDKFKDFPFALALYRSMNNTMEVIGGRLLLISKIKSRINNYESKYHLSV